MSFPAQVTRITKHAHPRYQLYQPGFNSDNGCWLQGAWVSVPKQDFEARKAGHEEMYGQLRALSAKQYYRDPEVPVEQMTKAQKQAWEHFSGDGHIYIQHANGQVGPANIGLGAGKITAESIQWLEQEGMKVLHTAKEPDGTVINQKEAYNIPEHLLTGSVEDPVDPWAKIVAQNKAAEQEMFGAYMEMGSEGSEEPDTMQPFMIQMAFTHLIMQEETIIQIEWGQSVGRPVAYADIDQERATYVEMRKKLKAKFGDQFDAQYEASRASHNSCARSNLGDSGVLYCFVLPMFQDDGTHETWGEKDVPWGSVGSESHPAA